jgi:LuxR family maltose regulon positive regulatory protein
MFFGRLAILRGDGAAFSQALASIAGLAEEDPQKSNRMEADLARSFLAGLLGRPQDAAEWLRHGPPEAFGRRLFIQALPFAHICRGRCLMLEGKPEILLGESPAVLGLAAAMNYTTALIYGHIQAAAAWAMRGREREALASLRKALDLAWPDALHLPFAEHGDALWPMLERLDFKSPRVKECIALGRRWKEGAASLRRALSWEPVALTPRQREIALLIRDGLTAKEIAAKLFLAESTVTSVRKTIYNKLNINSNMELAKMKL